MIKQNVSSRIITGQSSIFLDVLRLCAAFVVLFMHAFDRWFPTKAYRSEWPGEPSHVAVIVFFVLSGYVIAHTTISNNRGGLLYAQSRLSRLCSIVIPVILITALIQLIVTVINPAGIINTRGASSLRYVLSIFYLNEVWFFSAAPPFNGSLWSLSFEFWYYAIFGLWFFRRPGLKSIALVLGAILIAGPKIILMMPVWLSGYLAYRLPRPNISRQKAWLCLAMFLLAGGFVAATLPPLPYVIHLKPLYYANQFFTDWVIGIFVAGALWILPNGHANHQHTKRELRIRKIADLTFPLYVLHFPLLILWRAVFGINFNDFGQLVAAVLFVLVIAFVTGVFLEKQRPLWTKFFNKLLTFIQKKLTGPLPKKSIAKV